MNDALSPAAGFHAGVPAHPGGIADLGIARHLSLPEHPDVITNGRPAMDLGQVADQSLLVIQIGTKAGVRMIRKYLKGALLTLIKELFKKVGITFTRKSLERAVPIGGIFLSAGTSYALTKFVGGKVLDYLCLTPEVDGDSPETDQVSPAPA